MKLRSSRAGRQGNQYLSVHHPQSSTTSMFLHIASYWILIKSHNLRAMVIMIIVHSELSASPTSIPHSVQTYFWCHNVSGSSHQDGTWPMQSQCRILARIFPQKPTGMIPTLPTWLGIWKNQHLEPLLSWSLPHGHRLFFAGEGKTKQCQIKMEQDGGRGGREDAKRERQSDTNTPLKSQGGCVQSSLGWHYLVSFWAARNVPPTFLFSDFEFSQLQIEESWLIK